MEVLDVQEDVDLRQHLSLMLTEVRSLVCAPFWGPSGNIDGLIYADWTRRLMVPKSRGLARTQEVALKIEQFLREIASGKTSVPNPFTQQSEPQVARPAASITPPPHVPAKPYPSRSQRSFKTPKRMSVQIFLQSLAVMFSAGVSLPKSLWVLAEGTDDPAMGAAIEEVARGVERGSRFSAACARVQVFSPSMVSLLEVGEKTGRLANCLNRLAELEERRSRQRASMFSSMIYPAFVMIGCLVFLLLGPSIMLSSQVRLLNELQVEVPWLSQMLISLSSFLSWPPVWLAVLASAALVLRNARLRRRGALILLDLALRAKVLRRIWTAARMARWADSLALQVQSGLSIAESLRVSGEGDSAAVYQGLVDGQTLNQSLRKAKFPNLVVEMVKVGEETGKLDEMLLWLAGFYEEQFKSSLDVLVAMIEPAVMLTLGLVAGICIIVTMLPMVKALQTL
jgi:type IV pilus assembly protein PilC